jgi:ATP phosphoribosyltransferase regulatory subunit
LTAALTACKVATPRIDLGHVAIFRALAKHAGLSAEVETDLFAVLQAKDNSGLDSMTEAIAAPWRDAFRQLPELYGGAEVLAKARKLLPDIAEIRQALDDLAALTAHCGEVVLSIDLAELRGLHYHTGIVFAAYCAGVPNAIARGGRYDEVGRAFGRARPATGFSLYVNELMRVIPELAPVPVLRAPAGQDAALLSAIAKLRETGETVIQDLPGSSTPAAELRADRELVLKDGKWVTSKITTKPD